MLTGEIACRRIISGMVDYCYLILRNTFRLIKTMGQKNLNSPDIKVSLVKSYVFVILFQDAINAQNPRPLKMLCNKKIF